MKSWCLGGWSCFGVEWKVLAERRERFSRWSILLTLTCFPCSSWGIPKLVKSYCEVSSFSVFHDHAKFRLRFLEKGSFILNHIGTVARCQKFDLIHGVFPFLEREVFHSESLHCIDFAFSPVSHLENVVDACLWDFL